ncbi:MAG: hypothetical protein MI920_31190 [Kiloniellales bacterium]|nr:hypothetical protein [Kiloniellales bacterium]
MLETETSPSLRRALGALGLSLCLLSWLSGPAAMAAKMPKPSASFTAEGVVQINQDRVVFKVYHLAGKERQEISVDGLFQITILRPDLDKAFVLQPEADGKIELPLDEVSFLPAPETWGEHLIEAIGAAKEGGEATTRYRMTSDEASERELDLMLWVTDDGIVTRLEGEVEFEGEMESVLVLRRDIARTPLDPAIFDPDGPPVAVLPENAVPEAYRALGTIGP